MRIALSILVRCADLSYSYFLSVTQKLPVDQQVTIKYGVRNKNGLLFGICSSNQTVLLTDYGYSPAFNRFGTPLLCRLLQGH